MEIKEGHPWLLWPDSVSFNINKGDIMRTFEGESDFTLSMRLHLLSNHTEKKTIFAKLPNYVGVDLIENTNQFLLILNLDKEGEQSWHYLSSDFKLDYEYHFLTLRYSLETNNIQLLLDDFIVIEYQLQDNEKLSSEDQSHIIFGSGNFPKNKFNLNYTSYNTDFLMITKEYLTFDQIKDSYQSDRPTEKTIGFYDFKEKTDYKIYDKTGNCNFIHKILEEL